MTIGKHELRLQVGGTVNPRTGIYILRPSDSQLLDLLRQREYANVLSSRQMGKSSLLVRTKSILAENDYAVAAVDVAGYLGSSNTADEWYQGLLDEIAHQLQVPIDIATWWPSSRAITPNQRLIQFFREQIAEKCPKPTIIFLDEIDSTFKLPYTDDFFVAIRAMYNERAADPLYERLTFCLVGVASPNELIKDLRTTPYNIGRTIELQDFDSDRDDLNALFRVMSTDIHKGETIVRSVLKWTGGHPYLTVGLCDQLITSGLRSDDQVEELIRHRFANLEQLHSDVHFQQVIRFLGDRIEDNLAALALYRRILLGQKVQDHTTRSHIALKLSGLVKRDLKGNLIVRNEIYRRVFSLEWVSKSVEVEAEAFDKLLASLAPDRDLAAQEYEKLRSRLIAYFQKRGANFADIHAEDLADKTLDRVASRLDSGEVVNNVAAYCFGVARRVLLEGLRRGARLAPEDELLSHQVTDLVTDSSDERLSQCLERCLQKLSIQDQELLLDYFRSDRKVEHRKALAETLGVNINSLRLKASRLRQKLQLCISECLNKEIK